MISIVVTTCQRPRILSRALDSFLADPETGRDSPPVTVFDDSPESEGRYANGQVFSSFRSAYPGRVRYVASPEKMALAAELSDGNREEYGAIAFCFNGMERVPGGRGAGGNRNSALLGTAGEKVVSFDDDAFLPFYSAGGILVKAGADTGRRQPSMLLFPADRIVEIERMLWQPEADPLALFNEVLGSKAGQKGPVRAAMAGVCGGRWFSSPHAIFGTPAAAHRYQWKNRKAYEAAKRDPLALIQAPRIHFSNDPFLVTTCFGYDATVLLPPFFPDIRNSDGVWGFLVRCLYPDSPICHLPFAVSHDRSIRIPFTEEAFREVQRPSVSNLLLLLFEFFYRDLRSDNAAATLEGLGTRLAGLADAGGEIFRDLLTELFLLFEGRRIWRLREQLDEMGGRPRFLVKDMQHHIALAGKSLEHALPWEVRDTAFRSTDSEALLRDYFRRCGELMCMWPDFWEKAVRLNSGKERGTL